MADLKRYAILQEDGSVWSATMWDGVTPWEPPPGMTAVECPEHVGVGWKHSDGAFTYDPPPPPVPQSVSMFQAREALRRNGLLDAVNDYVATANDPTLSLAWEYATEVLRGGQFVTSLASNFSLDEAALDALFIEASSITV